MTRVRHLAAAGLLILTVAAPARADLTGVHRREHDARQPSGARRRVRHRPPHHRLRRRSTRTRRTIRRRDAPSLKTGMGNVILQTPVAFFGFQPYFTTGAGLYRETLGAHQSTGVALNTGGGVKVNLVGPLRLRVDYRIFKLGSGALNSPAHRVYAGLNLKFCEPSPPPEDPTRSVRG